MITGFSRQFGKPRGLQRFLDTLPGLISWGVLIAVLGYSLVKPRIGAGIIIIFHCLWCLRLVYMDFLYYVTATRLRSERETNWMERGRGIENLYNYWRSLTYLTPDEQQRRKTSLFVHREELRELEKSKNMPSSMDDIYHLVIFTVNNAKRKNLELGILSILQGVYPTKKILIVLAVEHKASQRVKDDTLSMQERFKTDFCDCLVSFGPNEGGVRTVSQGAVASTAAELAAEYFKKKEIFFTNVIVTRFEGTTSVGPDYFSCLTYKYLVSPDRLQASFQAIWVYNSDIWTSDSKMRILEVGSSFLHMIETANFQKYSNVLGESLCLQTLIDVGYWPSDLACEKTSVFWKALLHHKDGYRVVPMYVQVYRSIPEPEPGVGAIADCYRQRCRWARDIENFSFLIPPLARAEKIPPSKKFGLPFGLIGSHVCWAIWPFLVGILGWLPGILANRQFSDLGLYYTVPRIGKVTFILFVLIAVNSVVLNLLMLPKRKGKHNIVAAMVDFFLCVVFWPLSLFVGAAANLKVQTDLLFGNYQESIPKSFKRRRA